MKTITDEQIREEAEKWIDLNQDNYPSHCVQSRFWTIKMLSEWYRSQTGQEWVDGNERLPEDNHIVAPGQPQTKIVLLNDGTVLMGKYESHVWNI